MGDGAALVRQAVVVVIAMNTPTTTAAFDTAALERYLASHIAGFRGPLRLQQFSGGQSNPTYSLETPEARYVLRKKPGGDLLPSAHQIEREYRVMQALAATEVPVPQMLHLCEDASIVGTPFYVMEHADGRIFRDATLPDATSQERHALYEAMNHTLAALHQVDWSAAGLADFGKPTDYVNRQVARWSRQYAASRMEPIEAMDHLMEWLARNAPTEAADGTDTTLVHGDFRIENMVFHPTEPRVIAILDWELSTLGHPLSDLGYNCMNYHLPSQFKALGGIADIDWKALGIPTEADYVGWYQQRTGRPAERHMKFFLAFSLFRCAAILQGVRKRAVDGQGSATDAIQVGMLARPVADIAWDLARS